MMQESIHRLISNFWKILKAFDLLDSHTWAEGRLNRRSFQVIIHMIGPTFKITIPQKPCGINQTQMDWLRLLTSSDSSEGSCEVASLKNMSIPFRLTTIVLLKPDITWKKELHQARRSCKFVSPFAKLSPHPCDTITH